MKNFKRIIPLILFAFAFVCAALPKGSAMSISAGLDSLRGQWSRGKGPRAGGFSLGYSYFVPETDKKCPLVILMAGAGEGTPEGHELDANDFAYWSSEEFQARVPGAKGMYILILRAPEPIYFDTCPVEPMYAAISDFIGKHNIDTRRVIVGGWCIGASGATRLTLAHPELIDGLMLFSPRTLISSSEAQTLKNKRIWIFACKGDTYSNYATFALPSWNNIKGAASDRSAVRFTSCSLAPAAALLINHYTWLLAEQDFSPSVQGRYTSLKTVDGNEKSVASPEVISFMTFTDETVDETKAEETETEKESETEESETETSAKSTASQSETASKPDESVKDSTASTAAPENPGKKTALIAVICAAAAAVAGGVTALILRKRKNKERG